MAEALSAIRERLHRKSHEYFVFDESRRSRESLSMFYGATDALLDAQTAALGYGSAISPNTSANLLACYGFLQALYVQQDAVRTLSQAMGLTLNPNSNERLKEIREIRNRLTGHPALAGKHEKPPRLSSAIISQSEITSERFRGYVYYEDGAETIDVEICPTLKDNQEQLVEQMRAVEGEMDKQEQSFRSAQLQRPVAACFDRQFAYLLQRLWCDLGDDGRVGQAQAHAEMIRETMVVLRGELKERGLETAATKLYLGRIVAGLGLLESVMGRPTKIAEDQSEFDLMHAGIEKNVNSLKVILSEIDSKLASPIA
jgi:hypothetical protein